MEKKHPALLVLIMVVAFAIRIYHPVFRSLWGDEAQSFFYAYNFTSHDLISAANIILNVEHMPAYFILLAAWMKFFGFGEISLRSLSIALGMISVGVFYLFARQLFEERTALISAFLLSISPLAIMHSHEIRMYGLMLMLVLLSSYYFWKILSEKRNYFNMAGYVLFTLLLLLTHIYSILFISAQFVYLVYQYFKNKDLSCSLLAVVLQAVVFAAALPLYIKKLPFFNAGAIDPAFSVFPPYLKLSLFFFVLTLGETVAPWNFFIVPLSVLLFGFLFLRTFSLLSDKRTVFLFIMCLFPMIIAAFIKPTMPKYLIMCLPFYLLLIGRSLALLEPRSLRYSLIVLLSALQLMSVRNYFTLSEYHNSNQIEPWRKISSLIKDRFASGDIVVSSNRFITYRLLDYYLNIAGGGHYPLYCLQDGALRMPAGSKRIWFVSHILDDRIFPDDYPEKARAQIGLGYKLVMDEKFVKYEDTLSSKLPIDRHKPGSWRVRVSLYLRNK